MGVRDQILREVAGGGDPIEAWRRAARAAGMRPGKAYLTATGRPADGGDSVAPEEFEQHAMIRGGAQALLGVPHHNPTRNDVTMSWVRQRAARDLA